MVNGGAAADNDDRSSKRVAIILLLLLLSCGALTRLEKEDGFVTWRNSFAAGC